MNEQDGINFVRTTIQLVPEQMDKLDRMRKRLGINRSAMLAILIDNAPETSVSGGAPEKNIQTSS